VEIVKNFSPPVFFPFPSSLPVLSSLPGNCARGCKVRAKNAPQCNEHSRPYFYLLDRTEEKKKEKENKREENKKVTRIDSFGFYRLCFLPSEFLSDFEN